MLLQSHDELKSAIPCDAMAGVYLLGLGFPVLPPPRIAELDPAYSYYVNARIYLSDLENPVDVPLEDGYGLLLAMLPSLQEADDARKDIYTAFLIWQYIEVNKDKLPLAKGILMDSVKSSYSAGLSFDLLDLACTVKADIPIFEISQIHNSPIYRECVKEGLKKW